MKIFATKPITKNKFIKLSPILALLFLVSCAAPKNNLPMNFCDYVDPNSVYYNPNKLSLADLNNCRIQAEKVLAIQSLHLQIQKQREVVIALNNMNNTGNQSVNEIDSALSSLPPPNDPGETSNKATNTSPRTTASPASRNNSNGQGDINNRGRTIVVAQKTSPNSVQQRFLNSSANNKKPNNNLTSLSQREYDAKQAAHVATQVNNLLTSQNVQDSLNQTKVLLPGEETTSNIIQPPANTKPITKPVTTSEGSALDKIMNARKTASDQPVTQGTTPQVNPENKVNNNHPNTATDKTATEVAKINQMNQLSTSYTSRPPEPKVITAATDANPVANVVKPTAAANNKTDAQDNIVDNKSNVDNYQSSPLPALNGTTEVTPMKNTTSTANPLIHLQQNRTENKQ